MSDPTFAGAAADHAEVRAAIVPFLVTLLAAPALTASNGVPPAPAGAGSGSISGYTVSSVSYSLAGDRIDAVSFGLAPATATTVRARLAPDEPWSTCALSGGAASCPVATPLVHAVALEVAAS